jgi:lantibiotic modifying enzyme
LEFTLDEGLAGVVLFLLEWQVRNPDPIVTTTLRGGLRQLIHLTEATPCRAGFHAGHAGAASVLLRAALLLNDHALHTQALQWLDRLADHDFSGARPDFYAGTAGTAFVLGRVGGLLGRHRLVRSAEAHARALAAMAQRTDDGSCWPLVTGSPARGGLALGGSGVAFALKTIAEAVGESGWSELVDDALRWERHLLATDDQGTRLLTQKSEVGPSTYTWLRGLAGMAHARLVLSEGCPSHPFLNQECDLAMQALTRGVRLVGTHFSLADGLSGVGDVLLSAQHMESDATERRAALAWIADYGHQRHVKGDELWSCGAPGTGESPSLMNGISGIGLFYLRLADPAKVASPLLPDLSRLLKPPARAKTKAASRSKRSAPATAAIVR